MLLFTSTLRAAPIVPELSGQSSTYDLTTQENVITGHAQLVYGDAVLTANEIRINRNTFMAAATGQVALTRGPQRLLADRLTFRLTDGFFQLEHVRLGEFPVYISADSVAGTKAKMTFKNAVFTLHEPDPYTPTAHADTLVYEPGKFLIADGATIGIGPVRPLILPHLNQRTDKQSFLSYFSADAGYRSSLGPYAGLSLDAPVLPDVNLGGHLEYYAARGLLFGPSGDYAYDGGDQQLNGFFRGGYINDRGDNTKRGVDILGQPVPHNRGYFEWQHQQNIDDKITLMGDVNYWKDSEIIREFYPAEFNAVQTPDNFLEADYAGQNYILSAFTRFRPNNFEQVQERLPEIRFDLLPITVGAGFDERFSASADVLRDKPLSTGPILNSNRFDTFYGLERPIAPTNWFTFTPVTGGRLTYYNNATGAKDNYLRTLGEVGFDMELRSSGTWDYKNDQWHIDGLRHLFTPKISYRYIPEAEKGQAYIPPIDNMTFSPYLQPLDLGDMRNIDQLHRTDTMRLELDNVLQTRDPHYGSRNLLSLNVAEDFRFSRDPGDKSLSQTEAEVSATPVNWLEFNALEIVVPQQREQRELDTGFTIKDGEQRSFSFSNSFLHGQIEQYNFQYQERINEVYTVTETFTYDARL
ncbi:MAG TPA: LPS assembly protein LptD, partial [Opitutaceae bacterium]|nr:LPS assembly protein LptD [Opitutaceae bacterium]